MKKQLHIGKVRLDRPYEMKKETVVYILTAEDGFCIKSRMPTTLAMKELFQHAKISVKEEIESRVINTKSIDLEGVGVPLKVTEYPEVLSFEESSKRAVENMFKSIEFVLGLENYRIVSKEVWTCDRTKETCDLVGESI